MRRTARVKLSVVRQFQLKSPRLQWTRLFSRSELAFLSLAVSVSMHLSTLFLTHAYIHIQIYIFFFSLCISVSPVRIRVSRLHVQKASPCSVDLLTCFFAAVPFDIRHGRYDNYYLASETTEPTAF